MSVSVWDVFHSLLSFHSGTSLSLSPDTLTSFADVAAVPLEPLKRAMNTKRTPADNRNRLQVFLPKKKKKKRTEKWSSGMQHQLQLSLSAHCLRGHQHHHSVIVRAEEVTVLTTKSKLKKET